MKPKSGDKIKFGPIYCREKMCPEFLNKTFMLTPQYFEDYNGLYTDCKECPGIEIDGEAESIFHMFGNELDEFYDCILIPATPEDLKLIDDLRQAENEAIAADMGAMADFVISK